MSKKIPTGLFPSQSESDAKKKSPEYGLEVAQAIENEWFTKDSGTGRYQANRDTFHKLKLYARGEQPIQKYKNELSIDGDLSYLNLDWKPVPIVPKFVDIVVNGISERTYDLKAYSQDPTSIQQKTEYIENILRDIRNKELLDTIQAEFGINMYNNDKEKIPETEEELEIHMQLDFKQSIEIAEEEVIKNVMDHNKFDLIKKRVDYDITVLGIGACKTGFNTAEGITIRHVDPSNLIYSYTESPHFDDIYYVGEVERRSIVQLKKEYPHLTDEDIKEIENSNSGSRIYNTSGSEASNNNDNNNVHVLFFEYKTYKNQVFKIKETATGANKVIQKDDTFNPPKDARARFEKVNRSIEVIYKGAKIVGCNKILQWEMDENMTRPKADTTKAKFSYSIVAPRMYKGKIESLVSRMTTDADMIQITHLKLQQVLARMVPDGVFLDADGIADIDLGGGTNYSPREALNMYFQTGSVIGRSQTTDGDFNNGKVPIQELSSPGAGRKINDLVGAYNFYMSKIRDVTGLNEARDGSTPDPNALVGIQKLAAANSNTATRHIVQAGLYLTVDAAETVSLKVSDVLEYGNTTQSFINALGKFNVASLKEISKLHLHDFGIFLELSPDEEEKAILENNIQVALNKEQIYLEDAIDVREVKNIKLANQLLKIRRRKKQEKERQMQLENIEAQTAANTRAAQAAAELEVQKEQAISGSKVQVNQAQLSFDIKKLEAEARIKKELMTYEFDLNMRLKEKEMQVISNKDAQAEDRKDQRTKMQATQQSELIDQRNNNTPTKNFESKGMDTLGGFGTETYGRQ